MVYGSGLSVSQGVCGARRAIRSRAPHRTRIAGERAASHCALTRSAHRADGLRWTNGGQGPCKARREGRLGCPSHERQAGSGDSGRSLKSYAQRTDSASTTRPSGCGADKRQPLGGVGNARFDLYRNETLFLRLFQLSFPLSQGGFFDGHSKRQTLSDSDSRRWYRP